MVSSQHCDVVGCLWCRLKWRPASCLTLVRHLTKQQPTSQGDAVLAVASALTSAVKAPGPSARMGNVLSTSPRVWTVTVSICSCSPCAKAADANASATCDGNVDERHACSQQLAAWPPAAACSDLPRLFKRQRQGARGDAQARLRISGLLRLNQSAPTKVCSERSLWSQARLQRHRGCVEARPWRRNNKRSSLQQPIKFGFKLQRLFVPAML